MCSESSTALSRICVPIHQSHQYIVASVATPCVPAARITGTAIHGVPSWHTSAIGVKWFYRRLCHLTAQT